MTVEKFSAAQKNFGINLKPTFLPKKPTRFYGTDTLYGVKNGIKVKIFRNFAKFWKNFTLFSLITPQGTKTIGNTFRPKCSLGSCGKIVKKKFCGIQPKKFHLRGFISLERYFQKNV